MSKLWEALDLLRTKGMVKWTRSDGVGHCALGLLDEVYRHQHVYRIDGYEKDVGALNAVHRELFPGRAEAIFQGSYRHKGIYVGPTTTLADFNNHPDTTQQDLEQVFEKAAIRTDEVLS